MSIFDGLGREKASTLPIGKEGVEGVLDKFFKEVVIALRKNLNAKTHYDTLLGQSIIFTPKIFGQKMTFELSMNDYWKWVDEGRGETVNRTPHKPTLREKLQGPNGWIARKGLPIRAMAKHQNVSVIALNKQLAFLISRKIHKHGKPGNKFYSEVVTENLLKNLRQDIQKASKKEVEISIHNIIQQETKRK